MGCECVCLHVCGLTSVCMYIDANHDKCTRQVVVSCVLSVDRNIQSWTQLDTDDVHD